MLSYGNLFGLENTLTYKSDSNKAGVNFFYFPLCKGNGWEKNKEKQGTTHHSKAYFEPKNDNTNQSPQAPLSSLI